MIKDLKELEKLLKLCRKQGVQNIKLGEIEFKLGDLPYVESRHIQGIDQPQDPLADFPQGVLTPEQLIFYSSGGLPADDPYIDRGDN